MVKKKQGVLRRAREDTVQTYKDHPVTLSLLSALLTVPGAVIPLIFNLKDVAVGWAVAIAVSGAVLGPVVLVLAVFIFKLVTVRRHQLEDRVTILEERVAEQRDQIVKLSESETEDIDRFVPAYQDLKVQLGQCQGRIKTAVETQQIWGVMDGALPITEWKKHRNTLRAAGSPLYEPCAEAFSHVERINNISRFKSRPVRESDGLPTAHDSIQAACAALSAAIRAARPRQP